MGAAGVRCIVPLRLGIAVLVFSLGLAAASDASDAARELAHAAAKAEQKGDMTRAYALYAQAFALDPTNIVYRLRVQSFANMARVDPGLKPQTGAPVVTADAGASLDKSLFGTVTPKEAAEALQPLPPTELNAAPGLQDIDIRGNARDLFEKVSKMYGLLATFDTEFQPQPVIHFQLSQADYRTALHALEDATGAFVIPVADRLIFIAADTPAKRQQFERTATITVPIPETLTTQELQEIATAVRSTMDIQRLMVDTTNRLFVMRDRVSKVRPAEFLAEDLMRPQAQVELEVDLLSVDSSDSLQWGLALPNSFPVIGLGKIASYVAQSAAPNGFAGFLTFGGGASLFGIGVADANLLANVTKSLTHTALRSRLVAEQGQPATLHVGSKYPIITSTFIGSTPGVNSGFPPDIQFQDLGLELKITPYIHGTDDVSLAVEASYTLLGQVDGNGIPTINDRKFQSTVRLHDGEWAVLTGLLSRNDAATVGGLAGVGETPAVGAMLNTNSHTKLRTDTLLVIKPRLTRLPPTDHPGIVLPTGTESRPASLL